MSEINFFTALTYQSSYNSFTESLTEVVDDYFCWEEKKACVVEGLSKDGNERVVMQVAKTSLIWQMVKCISYFTGIIPLGMLVCKAVLRANRHFKVLDPQHKLAKGLQVPSHVPSKLQQLMNTILAKQDDTAIEWINKDEGLLNLKEVPQIVFYVGKNAETVFENMVKAKEVCLVHRLGLLAIPSAQKLEIEHDKKTYTVIARQYVEKNPDDGWLYYLYTHSLDATMRQLAIFIAKTNLSRVGWDTVPVVNDKADPKRISLIDLTSMTSALQGFIGDPLHHNQGLLRCVSKGQQKIVMKEVHALMKGVSAADYAAVQSELDHTGVYCYFCKIRGISAGGEQIQAQVNELGLNLAETEQGETLGSVAQELIEAINKMIESADQSQSIMARRLVTIGVNRAPFIKYNMLGSASGETWVMRILRALCDKRAIFHFMSFEGGYAVQA